MKNYIARALSIIMSIIICISFTFGGNAMAIAETISGNASSDASSNAVPMATDNNNDVYTFKDKDAGVKVLVAKKDSWDNGYVADISIENTGSEALTNWHIGLKVKGDIDSVWNSEYEVKDGKLTLSYPTWKRKISAGETYTIGMKVNGAFGDLEDFSYYEDARDVSDLYKIEYKVRNTWSHHAIIDAVITNTGETTLRDWTVIMDYDADIIDMWNADVVSNEGGSYRLKCKDYNADIKPDESVTFGFQAVYEEDEVVLPANSKLYAVADSKLVPTKTDKVDWYKVMTNADSDEAIRMRDSVKDRVKVAIIDSGVDYMGEGDEINRVDFIGDTDEENPLYDDRSGHGTGVAGMLLGAGEEDETEEEETTEAPVSDMDFSYLTDADYIEAVDVEDDEESEVDDEDDEDYDDYDDSEVYEDDEDYDDYDIEDESEENEVIEDEDVLEDVDTGDDEEDLDDDLNLFEYNDLYGDIEGLNSNIDLTSLRVLDEDNEAPVSRVVEAIEWAIDNDINILNLSWGVDTDNAELHNVIKRAYNKGMLIIAAAGNDGEITYPAKYDEVIAVGSVDNMAKIATSSASGDGIELVAPAENVIAYTSFGILTFVSGTSYAAPQITALASILWQQDITVSNKCIRELLRQSASPLGDSMSYGYGFADYEKAAGMYEEFVKNYEKVEENAELTDVESGVAEAPEVNVVDEEYVRGLWGNHDSIISGDAEENVGNIDDRIDRQVIIDALKAGIYWTDVSESGVQGMTNNPGFHGGVSKKVNGNVACIDTYLELMTIAKALGNMCSEEDVIPGVTTTLRDQTSDIIKRYKEQIEQKKEVEYYCYDVSGNASGNASSNASSNAEINNKVDALFVMGMALHTLGDLYAHQSYGLVEKGSYYYEDKVYKVPSDYYRIVHGIKIKKMSDSMKVKLGVSGNETSDYYDNRADCRDISPYRYLYTKAIYKKIMRNKVNFKSDYDSMPCVSDFYCEKISGITKSTNLKDRIKDLVNHFGIKNFRKFTSGDTNDVSKIDLTSLCKKYRKWAMVTFKLDYDVKKINVSVYKVSSDASGNGKENVLIASSDDNTSMFDNKKGKYTIICDTGVVYVVKITGVKDGKVICSTKKFKVDKDGSDMKPVKTSSLKIHHHSLKKGYMLYNIKTTKMTIKHIRLLTTKEIKIKKADFKKTKAKGCVKDINDRISPVSGVMVTLTKADEADSETYSVVSDLNGEYIFEGDNELTPGMYSLTASKDGVIDNKGVVAIKGGTDNILPNLYMDYGSRIRLGTIVGTVIDKKNNKKVKGISVNLYEGDYIEGKKPIMTTSSNADGKFSFENIRVGVYEIYVTDYNRQYIDNYYTVNVTPYKTVIISCPILKIPERGKIRVVLTWSKGAKDLDGWMYGYYQDCEKICYYDQVSVSNDYFDILLDRDNYHDSGTETIIATPKSDCKFKYSVRIYRPNNVYELAHSDATVKVYTSSGAEYEYKVPLSLRGYVWDVFEYDCAKDE